MIESPENWIKKPRERYYQLLSMLYYLEQQKKNGNYQEFVEKENLRNKIIEALMKAGIPGPMNGLTIAYYAVYGTLPPHPLVGKTDAPKRKWREYNVDSNLKDQWLEDLNSLSNLKLISIEEGEGESRPAHIMLTHSVFALHIKIRKISELPGRYYLKDFIEKTYSVRHTIAGKVKPGDKDWEEWFEGTINFLKEIQ